MVHLADPVIRHHATVSQRIRGAQGRRSHRNLCSRDRSRVYGMNCSTTTARFLRVAVTTYFYTHEKKSEGGRIEEGFVE